LFKRNNGWIRCRAEMPVSYPAFFVGQLPRPVEPYEQRMPKARILSHQIDKDSIETLDQKDGLFNPVKVEDVRNFDSVSQDAMEERAIENGILDKAFENAKNIIRKIIDNDLVEELGYTVCFETIE